MTVTDVGPGERDQALAAAKNRDQLVFHGDQPGTNTNITKTVTLEGSGDEVMRGRYVFQAAGIVSLNLRYNGKGGPSGGPASWTVSGAGCQFVGCDMTNEHSAIGINTYNGGDDLLIERNLIHAIGKLTSSSAWPPSDQPIQHKDGTWSGNHDHGIYLTGARGVVRENVIRDCSDRAVQLRGSNHTTVTRNLGLDCGMGLMFGDLNDTFDAATLNLWLDNQVEKRTLIESYQPGASDSAADWAFNTDGRNPVSAPGVNTTACKTGDPRFDRATMKLAADSPALGYGPTSIQPGVPPPPDPTNRELRDQAVLRLQHTTVGMINKYWKTPPPGTEWWAALDLLNKIN